MTISRPNRNDLDAADAQNTDCLLYLFGELDAESRKRFEQRLASNPDLSDALLEQASLISSISQTRVLDAPQVHQVATQKSHRVGVQQWRWVAALASIAACVALTFQFQRFLSEPETVTGSDESVLIAQAWASSHKTLNSETAESPIDELVDPQTDEPFDVVLDEQPSDIDSTLSWMYVAIASNADASSSELLTDEGTDG